MTVNVKSVTTLLGSAVLDTRVTNDAKNVLCGTFGLQGAQAIRHSRHALPATPCPKLHNRRGSVLRSVPVPAPVSVPVRSWFEVGGGGGGTRLEHEHEHYDYDTED